MYISCNSFLNKAQNYQTEFESQYAGSDIFFDVTEKYYFYFDNMTSIANSSSHGT
jgi:hypothetical protein